MTVVDIIVLFVIGFSALFGVMRGFVKEAISLIKWILATWIAATFAAKLAPMLPIDSDAAAQATAFAVLFITIFVVGSLASFVVSTIVKTTGLSGPDRVFGLLFGVLRGAMIVVVFVVIGQKVSLPDQGWWQESVMLEKFEQVAIKMQELIPGMQQPAMDTREVVKDAAGKVIENVDPADVIEMIKQ